MKKIEAEKQENRKQENRKQENRKKGKRKKEIGRVIVAGILAAGLFGGGFAVLNHLALAAEHDSPVELQSVVPEAMTEEVLPSDGEEPGYEKADYKVETEGKNTVPNAALSAEEAADIGAQYLWEVYGIDLNAYTISMFYAEDPTRAIGYWHGEAYKTGSSRENYRYQFGIEAVSGERDSIGRESSSTDMETIPYREKETQEYYRENCGEYLEKAKVYAESQHLTAPLKAEYIGTAAMLAPGYEYEITEGATSTMAPADERKIIMVPRGEEIPATFIYVNVLVTDAAGKQVSVEMDTSDQSLSFMLNCYNGVDFDPDSVG